MRMWTAIRSRCCTENFKHSVFVFLMWNSTFRKWKYTRNPAATIPFERVAVARENEIVAMVGFDSAMANIPANERNANKLSVYTEDMKTLAGFMQKRMEATIANEVLRVNFCVTV